MPARRGPNSPTPRPGLNSLQCDGHAARPESPTNILAQNRTRPSTPRSNNREAQGFLVANGELELAKTPPRGWNSYDSFSWVINEAEFLNNAEIVSERLLTYGYEYVVVDFLWYRKNEKGAQFDSYGYDNIDEWGRPIPDPERWPSSIGGKGFKIVAEKVHEMGLKFGIHVMRGISTQAVNASKPILDVHTGVGYAEGARKWSANDIGLRHKTCAWMKNGFMSVNTDLAAGKAFLKSLYQQYAEWGVDFVKLDCVFGGDFESKEIIAVSKFLEELERPVVFSISPGTSVTPSMAEDITRSVNMYRITADDWDTWPDVTAHFDVSREFAAAKKIGAKGFHGRSWPDLDMLPLGWLTDPKIFLYIKTDAQEGPHRKCKLSLDEQKTQMTLWSIAKSPLMFGGDLRQIDRTTFNLITNPTILEINSYSTNNMEFHHVFAKENPESKILALKKLENQIRMAEDKVLHLTSCNDEKAKGWFVVRQDGSLDQTCWNSDTKTSDSLPYCLAIKKNLLTSDEDIINKHEYKGRFHLSSMETADACLDASVNGKHSASEMRNTWSTCRWHAKQIWGLNENGTLMNSYSNLCAIISSKKVNTINGVRSWIATGRRGEIYVSFFNLNDVRALISAKISDLTKVLGSSFFSKGSCNCTEIWSGRSLGLVRGKLSAMVEKHGCSLFVLSC
ncbi:uncharacterized protein [Typha latifolia]|uniref:uncharacterized protein isoform X3 n=1 Tax=Typha latifolia TaxID=4733 RepID=UPI003C2BD3D7